MSLDVCHEAHLPEPGQQSLMVEVLIIGILILDLCSIACRLQQNSITWQHLSAALSSLLARYRCYQLQMRLLPCP